MVQVFKKEVDSEATSYNEKNTAFDLPDLTTRLFIVTTL